MGQIQLFMAAYRTELDRTERLIMGRVAANSWQDRTTNGAARRGPARSLRLLFVRSLSKRRGGGSLRIFASAAVFQNLRRRFSCFRASLLVFRHHMTPSIYTILWCQPLKPSVGCKVPQMFCPLIVDGRRPAFGARAAAFGYKIYALERRILGRNAA